MTKQTTALPREESSPTQPAYGLARQRDQNPGHRAQHVDNHEQKKPREPLRQSSLKIRKVGLSRQVAVRPFKSGETFRFC